MGRMIRFLTILFLLSVSCLGQVKMFYLTNLNANVQEQINARAKIIGTNLLSANLLYDGASTNELEFDDFSRIDLDGTDTSVGGVATLYLDGGVTTLRGVTNLQVITPAVMAGTATTNQALTLTDSAEGTVEFVSVTTPTTATNIALATGLSAQSGIYTPPESLGWPAAYHFQAAELPNGKFAALVNPRALVDQRIWSGPAYYVATNGNDTTGTGLSAAPVRSIWKAVQLGNSNGTPYRVMIGAGMYRMTNSMNGYPSGWPTPPVSALIEPTQPCAFIAHNGRVEHSAMKDVSTFPTVKDGTYGNCYVLPNTEGTRRVFDRLTFDQYGNFTELVNAASLAACDATPNSWYQSGSSLYLNRTDGVAPTFNNTLTLQNTYTAAFLSNTSDLYFEGIDFLGGNSGALHIDPVSTRNVVAVGCSFRYAGSSAFGISGLRVRRVTGLCAFFRCFASGNSTDGLNFHADGSSGMYVLTSQCRAIANGVSPNTSCNGWTTHDNVIGIDIGGEYGPHLDGACVHAIETTKSWLLGTVARRSTLNGSAGNSPFKVSNSGAMTLEHCLGFADASTNYTFYVQLNASTGLTLSTRFFDGVVTNETGTTLTQHSSSRPRVAPLNIPFATTDPTATDDSTKGFGAGSWWRNITTSNLYQLVIEAPAGAVWKAL